MSIFDQVEKTDLQRRYETIKSQAVGLLMGEKNRCISSFNSLWRGLETKEQAQEILDMFGNEAYLLFTTHAAWQDFIATCDPTWERLTPPFALTYNNDGTVTVGEKI